MAKNKEVYVCSACGYESTKWAGQCFQCHAWNTLEAQTVVSKNSPASGGYVKVLPKERLQQLSEITVNTSRQIETGIRELDRVLGGGITRDGISILAARPGAGKSTLLMQMAQAVADIGYKVLYVSGEESGGQLRRRAERIFAKINNNIWIHPTVSMNEVLAAVEEIDPALIILDSIQTFSLAEFPSRPGSPTQVVECTNAVLKIAKNPEHPRAVFMAGQLTKDDELAGVRALEHMVDTVLYMEADVGEELRILSATKNRFGSTGEMGFFTMEEHGLRAIDNPSEYFMTRRETEENVTGSSLTVVKEGTRPIVAEIEALVSRSFTPYPSRIAECMKRDQLATLISILEQRGNLSLYDKNVVVKTAGGLKLSQQSANLAVIMAMVSASWEKPIPTGTVFIGDVGLTGELKRVPSIEMMVRELDRMKFNKVYLPWEAVRKDVADKCKEIEICQVKSLAQVLKLVFGSCKKDFTPNTF